MSEAFCWIELKSPVIVDFYCTIIDGHMVFKEATILHWYFFFSFLMIFKKKKIRTFQINGFVFFLKF